MKDDSDTSGGLYFLVLESHSSLDYEGVYLNYKSLNGSRILRSSDKKKTL